MKKSICLFISFFFCLNINAQYFNYTGQKFTFKLSDSTDRNSLIQTDKLRANTSIFIGPYNQQPAEALHVVSNFRVDGKISLNGSFGTAGQLLISNGSGSNPGWSFISFTSITGVLPINKGGTNSSATLNNNRIIISSGGAIVESSVITANRAIVSSGTGLPIASTTTDTQIGYLSGATGTTGTGKLVFDTSPSVNTITVRDVTGSATRFLIDTEGRAGLPTISTTHSLRVNKNMTGGVIVVGISSAGQIQTDATSAGVYIQTAASISAGSSTTAIIHNQAVQGTFGAGSTVGTQYAYFADATLTGAGTNIGYYGGVPVGANNYNIYMPSQAQVYINGNTGIGYSVPSSKLAVNGTVSVGASSTDASAIVDFSSTTKGILPPRMTSTNRDAISSPATGLVIYNTTTNRLNYYNGTAWIALIPLEVSATKSAVSAATTLRFVSVTADETYSGSPSTLYYHNGTSLTQVLTAN